MRLFAKDRKGFSILEAAIVLTIAGTITGGIWAVLRASKDATLANTLVSQVQITNKNIRTYFAARPIPSTAADLSTNYTTDVIRKAGLFSTDMCSGTCTTAATASAYNVYGGTIVFRLVQKPGGMPEINQYMLTLTAVQKRGCVQMGMNFGSKAIEMGLISMQIGVNTAITSFPILPATLDTQCSGAAAGNSIVLIMQTRNS